MHGRVMAERRAVAEQSLDESIALLAGRAGISLPDPVGSNDVRIRDLFRIERLAQVADALAGIRRLPTGEQAPAVDPTTLTVADLVEARVRGIPRLPREVEDAILAAIADQEAEDALRDRLLALDGVGDATADAVLWHLQDAGVPEPMGAATLEELEDDTAALREALAFAASVIKSGEAWSEECEAFIAPLLSAPAAESSAEDAGDADDTAGGDAAATPEVEPLPPPVAESSAEDAGDADDTAGGDAAATPEVEPLPPPVAEAPAPKKGR